MADEILGEKKRTCECDICKQNRHIQAVIERRDVDELIATLRATHDAYFNVSADNDYYQCILDGSWPSGKEIMERVIEKWKTHPNRKLE